ncbi:MAG: dihydropteroate synthase [Deltaproteobacteria bacterium]|nr:dihydropteroate synthase [Candidatus Zymogenaceae bacterium]
MKENAPNDAPALRESILLDLGGKTWDLGRTTLVMGVLNVTPDSFSDGGVYSSVEAAVEQAMAMEQEGAHIIDVGGESSRPGAMPVSAVDEIARTIPVIEGIRKKSDIPISIDTTKAEVAARAAAVGASIINDITALSFDPNMAETAAALGLPMVLMHIKGTPRDMQDDPHYDDLVGEIFEYLKKALARATACGIAPEKIILDPGIGFGKTCEDNLTIIRNIPVFARLGRPILIGASRKAFIGGILGKDAHNRASGSVGAACAAALWGAHIVRVHDVAQTIDALKVVDAVRCGVMPGGA